MSETKTNWEHLSPDGRNTTFNYSFGLRPETGKTIKRDGYDYSWEECDRGENPFEESWMTMPFETYEGMDQHTFQAAIAPYQAHGTKRPVVVPKGWRRVEGQRLGKHFYVHMETGTITFFPREIYHCQKEMWITTEGEPFKEGELDLWETKGDPEASIPPPTKPSDTKPAAPKPAAKPATKPAAKPAATPAPAKPTQPPLPCALLFPGQGSQYVKMMAEAKDIPAVADMLKSAKTILGYDILDVCLNGPESKLGDTQFCQPAMYIGGLAAVEKLKKTKPECVERCKALAGLSLGEYTALTVAGVFSFEEGLKLVKLRGEAMKEAATASEQAMCSVAGLEQSVLEDLCKKAAEASSSEGFFGMGGEKKVCQIANLLFPKGFSVAGDLKAVQKLEELAKAAPGCLQAKLLKTSGGFHTSLMQPAREKLEAALSKAVMQPPRCPVYMNVTGEAIAAGSSPDKIKELLAEQLTNNVLWEPLVRNMIKDGVQDFYECGPMKQLKAMMKRIDSTSWERTTTVDV